MSPSFLLNSLASSAEKQEMVKLDFTNYIEDVNIDTKAVHAKMSFNHMKKLIYFHSCATFLSFIPELPN